MLHVVDTPHAAQENGHEALGVAELDEVRDERVAQRVQVEVFVEPCVLARGGEGQVDRAQRDPPGTFVDPQRGVPVRAQRRAHLLEVVLDDLDDPVELGNRQHGPPFRRAAGLGLPVTHEHRSALAIRSNPRVVAQVTDIQAPCLGPAQAERVDELEHRRIAQRRQRALAAQIASALHAGVHGVEQRLDLVIGQRAPARPALELGQMRRRVPLADHLNGEVPELLEAHLLPAVAGRRDVLHEQPHRHRVAAHRGVREHASVAEAGNELLPLPGGPLPRVLIRELREPLDQPFAVLHRVRLQIPRLLLKPPAAQYRLEHPGLTIDEPQAGRKNIAHATGHRRHRHPQPPPLRQTQH